MGAKVAALGFDRNHSRNDEAASKARFEVKAPRIHSARAYAERFGWRVITSDDLQQSDYLRHDKLIETLCSGYDNAIGVEDVHDCRFLDCLCIRMRKSDFFLTMENMFCLYGNLLSFPHAQMILVDEWWNEHSGIISSLDSSNYPFLASMAQTAKKRNAILRGDNIISLPRAFYQLNVDEWLRECSNMRSQFANTPDSFLSVCKDAEIYVVDTIFTQFFEWLLRGECWNSRNNTKISINN